MKLSNEVITQAAKAAGVKEGCQFFLISKRKRGWQTVYKIVVARSTTTIAVAQENVPSHLVADIIRQNVTSQREKNWMGKFISNFGMTTPPIFLVEACTDSEYRHQLVLVSTNQKPCLIKGEKIVVSFNPVSELT